MTRAEIVNAVSNHLFDEEDGNIFAVLDGAAIPELRDVLHELNPPHCCLYRGQLEPDIAEVAPYLINLEPDGEFTRWVIEKGWGNHWGVFAASGIELSAMRNHLRKFLTVHNPNGNPVLFRYYDPRVLRVYLPTCNADELKNMFGPIDSYYLEGEDPAVLLRYRVESEALRQEELNLQR